MHDVVFKKHIDKVTKQLQVAVNMFVFLSMHVCSYVYCIFKFVLIPVTVDFVPS